MEPTDTDEGCNGCDKEAGKSHSEEHTHTHASTLALAGDTLKIDIKNWKHCYGIKSLSGHE